MKSIITTLLTVVAAATTFFMIGRITAEGHVDLNAKTAENLSMAMHGEAFAYAKYTLFAQHARQSGNKELADLFESSAKTERFEHFAEEAKIERRHQGRILRIRNDVSRVCRPGEAGRRHCGGRSVRRDSDG